MLMWMYRVMERKVNRMVRIRIRDGRKEKSNANLYLYKV